MRGIFPKWICVSFSQLSLCLKLKNIYVDIELVNLQLVFFVSSQTELKFIYKRPEIKKEMMSLILINCFFQLTPCPSFWPQFQPKRGH